MTFMTYEELRLARELVRLAARTWQRLSGDNWVFGVPVRGVIRRIEAEVYYDDRRDDDPRGGWVWFVVPPMPMTAETRQPRGVCANLQIAVEAAEKAMGIE